MEFRIKGDGVMCYPVARLAAAGVNPVARGCSRLGAEPGLSDLMQDPLTVALMAADRVDRRELNALLDQARCKLQRRLAG
jgi:hypothetical protein